MTALTKPRPMDILLVEDDPEDVLLVKEALKACRTKHRVSVARDGEEGLAYVRGEGRFAGAARPSLILLDLNLPRKDGRELLADLKSDDRLKRIPVIVFTTSDAESDVVQCYDLHANAFVTKPTGLDRLEEILRRIEDFWLDEAKLPH